MAQFALSWVLQRSKQKIEYIMYSFPLNVATVICQFEKKMCYEILSGQFVIAYIYIFCQ